MNRKVLLVSSGPYQFINELSYVFQNQLRNNVIGVLRYSYSSLSLPPDLFKCERWLYDSLQVPFLGPPVNLWQIWGKNPIAKLAHLPSLNRRIRLQLTSLLNGIEPDEITDIVLPYRTILEDVLLISGFKNARIHFIDEGASMGFKSHFRLPFPLNLMGYNNPYRKNVYKEIFVKTELETSLGRFGKIKILDPELTKSNIYDKIIHNNQFSTWFESNFGKYKSNNLSIFLLQPLDRMIKMGKEVEFYKKVLEQELKSINYTILIKFHPRDDFPKREFIYKELTNMFGDKVTFFPNDFLSLLPFEIFLNVLNVKKLIGINTTSLLLSNHYKFLDSSVYSSKELPESARNNAKKIAQLLNVEIIEF